MEYAPLPTPAQLDALARTLIPGGGAVHLRRIEGGLGCTTDVLGLRGADGGGRDVVLRRYGPWWQGVNREVGTQELAALRLARRAGLPVPEPLWEDRNGLFGEPTIVIGFVPDARPVLEPRDPWDFARQLSAFLVRLHGLDVDPDTAALLPDLPAAFEKLATLDEPSRSLAAHPRGRALWERACQELRVTTFPERVFVHNDFWPGNVLWRDGQLVAVVDFEECGLGDPAQDVAYCSTDLRYLGHHTAADDLIRRYRKETGRTLATLFFWELVALARPLPDIARWLPGWQLLGCPHVTADELRARHAALLERALTR
ncbi:MAG: aminoglycoside phosphotransferase family protein [Myxococcota bacterium]